MHPIAFLTSGHLVLGAVLFEVLGPRLMPHATGDARDIACYWLGGLVAWAWWNRDQLRQRLATLETIFPSETRWKYSNLALTLAGEIVAAISEQPYADYVQKRDAPVRAFELYRREHRANRNQQSHDQTEVTQWHAGDL